MANKLPPYTFGVEIECFSENLHPAIVTWTLRNAGFKVNDQLQCEEEDQDYEDEYDDDGELIDNGPRNRTPVHTGEYDADTWIIGSDGSITGLNGMEIKSPILSGVKGLKEIRRLTYYLNKLGVKVNTSCGLHVHVGITNAENKFKNEEVVTILRRYLDNQAEIDTFLARSRRGTRNTFCQPINTLVETLEGAITPAFGPEAPPRNWTSMSPSQRSHWISYGQGQYYWESDCRYHTKPEFNDFANMPLTRIAMAGQHYDRVVVSVSSLSKYGTIEFRQHHGTINGAKITNWIIFLLNHVENSRKLYAQKTKVAEESRGRKPHKDHVFKGLPTRVRRHFITQKERLSARRSSAGAVTSDEEPAPVAAIDSATHFISLISPPNVASDQTITSSWVQVLGTDRVVFQGSRVRQAQSDAMSAASEASEYQDYDDVDDI